MKVYYGKLTLLLFIIFVSIEQGLTRGINGGIGCAACTLVSAFVIQLADVKSSSVIKESLILCELLPSKYKLTCILFVKNIEPIIISKGIIHYLTPDVLCYGIHFCSVEKGSQYCHLFPKPQQSFHEAVEAVRLEVAKNGGYKNAKSFDVCSLPLIKDLCNDFYDWFDNMKPALDYDNDYFSPIPIGRGSFWRGKDCSDFSQDVYPGRYALKSDKIIDSNCNGIYGYDGGAEGWEDVLCNGTDPRGTIVVGDSVGAHFHMPEAWFDPMKFTLKALTNISIPLMDELDFPQLGFSTGFVNSSYPALIQGYTDSIYLRLRERNRCNHRDYQNLCRNGELSFFHVNTSEKIARNKNTDKPVLLLYEELGNDVCNNNPDTLHNMTSPKQFKLNVMKFLNSIDQKLPNGSHVLLIGLANGSRLYHDMAERYHPLGRFHKNLKYKDMYNWFLCMQIGPCNGWMNPNAYIRSETSIRAKELSQVLQDIANESKRFKMFNSFKVHYMDNFFDDVFRIWEDNGGEAWELYEPVDSFHPNQLAQPLIASVIWNKLLNSFPEAVGPVNPNNKKIDELFKDQGGH